MRHHVQIRLEQRISRFLVNELLTKSSGGGKLFLVILFLLRNVVIPLKQYLSTIPKF